MNKLALKLVSATLAVCCVLGSAVLTGCGKDKEAETYDTAPGVIETAPSAEKPDGTGMKIDHVKAAGFDMYKDTLADITAKDGAPLSTKTDEYTGEIDVSATYDFGSMCFTDYTGTSADSAVLIIADIYTGRSMPGGFGYGDDLYDVADSFYAGSSDKIKAAQDEVWLYGDENADSYGKYGMLDTEYVTSDSAAVSYIEYRMPCDNGGYVRCTFYFDSANKVCENMIFWGSAK